MDKTISLIVPTYNERENVLPLVKRISSALSGYSYEIVFMDDDSPDGTAQEAISLADSYPVRAIVRQGKRGLAPAVVEGIRQASGQVIVVIDADLQHPPEVIPELVKKIEEGADIAVASRYIPGGGCQGWSRTRKIISRGAIFLAHLLLPATRQVSDPMSGFFAFRKSTVTGSRLKPTGYKILLEIIMMTKSRAVAEVPYTFNIRDRGESKLNAKQQIAYLKHLFSLMQRGGELARFIKFCLVGASGVLVNIGLLALLTEVAGLFYILSATIGIEVSIITNFLLNNYFTFADRRHGQRSLFNRLLRFNLVSLAGVGINLGILGLFTEVWGVFYIVSNLIGIVAATIWNYLVNNWWTWKQ